MKALPLWITAAVLCLTVSCSGARSRSGADDAPDATQLRMEAAAASLSEGDATGALQLLQKIETEAKDRASFFHIRALAYSAKGNATQAIVDAEQALKLDPKFTDARNSLGKFLIDAGRLADAKNELRKAAADPLYREAYKSHTLLGIAHYRLGELPAAEQSLQAAMRADSGRSCLAYYYAGHVAMKQGKLEDAIRSYEKSTQRFCVAFVDGHLAHGIALKRAGQTQQARVAFLSIRERFPRSQAALKALQYLKELP